MCAASWQRLESDENFHTIEGRPVAAPGPWRGISCVPDKRSTSFRRSKRGEGLVRERGSSAADRRPGCGGKGVSGSSSQGPKCGGSGVCEPRRRGDAPKELGRGTEVSEEGGKAGAADDRSAAGYRAGGVPPGELRGSHCAVA